MQLAKYRDVLAAKPLNKIYIFIGTKKKMFIQGNLKCFTLVQNVDPVNPKNYYFPQNQAYHLSHLPVNHTGFVQRIAHSCNEAPTFQAVVSVCIVGGMLWEDKVWLLPHQILMPATQASSVSREGGVTEEFGSLEDKDIS